MPRNKRYVSRRGQRQRRHDRLVGASIGATTVILGVGALFLGLNASSDVGDPRPSAVGITDAAVQRPPNTVEISDNVDANNELFDSIVDLYNDVINGNDDYELIVHSPYAPNGTQYSSVDVTINDSATGTQIAQLRFDLGGVPDYVDGVPPQFRSCKLCLLCS